MAWHASSCSGSHRSHSARAPETQRATVMKAVFERELHAAHPLTRDVLGHPPSRRFIITLVANVPEGLPASVTSLLTLTAQRLKVRCGVVMLAS